MKKNYFWRPSAVEPRMVSDDIPAALELAQVLALE